MECDILKQLPSLASSGLRLGSTSLSLRMIDASRERAGVCVCVGGGAYVQTGAEMKLPQKARSHERTRMCLI